MDGNFSAEHMRCRTGEAEVPLSSGIPLSSGMAFMADPDSYKAHLCTAKDVPQVSGICTYDCHRIMFVQVSTCNTYKAIEQANSRRPHLDVTGIGTTACCHGFFLPASVVDFQKGERLVPLCTVIDTDNEHPRLGRSIWTIASAKHFHIIWKAFPWPW